MDINNIDVIMLVIIMFIFMSDFMVVNSQNLERGVAFPEDILIGPKTLFTKGSIILPSTRPSYDNYTLTLLPVEGNIKNFVNTYGYLAGFQWYNTETPIQSNPYQSITFQVYSYKPSQKTGIEPPLGEYELVAETYVTSEYGFNEAYFQEGLPIKPGLDYYIGMKTDDSGGLPVLYEKCDGDEVYLQLHGLRYSSSYNYTTMYPIIFTESNIKGCAHFSMQGIFVPTMAASGDINCTYMTAEFRQNDYISLYSSYDGKEIRNLTQCWIIRADRSDRTIVIKNDGFNFGYLTNTNDCRFRDNVKMEEFKKFDGTSAQFSDSKLWGYYCGSYDDIFEDRETSLPYLSIVATMRNDYNSFYFSMYASVEEYEDLKIGLGVTFTLLVIIGLVILTLWLTRNPNKQSATDSEPLAGADRSIQPDNTVDAHHPAGDVPPTMSTG